MNLELSSFATITHHDGAIICSYETVLDLPLDAAKPKLIAVIEAIQRYVENENGIVGHIKAFAEESGQAMTFSATGGKVSTLPGDNVQTSISLAVIVFDVNEKELQSLVEDLFDE